MISCIFLTDERKKQNMCLTKMLEYINYTVYILCLGNTHKIDFINKYSDVKTFVPHDYEMHHVLRKRIRTVCDTIKLSIMNTSVFDEVTSERYFTYHFYVRTVKLWNLLPSDIATATSKDNLKLQATAWITPMEWARIKVTWKLI